MSRTWKDAERRFCPKTGKPIQPERRWWRSRWLLLLYPAMGILSLIWFLIRVVPKPSRAAYPCQQVAAPLASSFVVWLTGVLGSILAFRKARTLMHRSRYVVAALAFVVGAAALYLATAHGPAETVNAADLDPRSEVKPANQPVGTPRGLYPGRVVWVHDPDSTNWADSTPSDYYDDYWWREGETDQAVVNEMMSNCMQWLTATTDDSDAWDALFKHFNGERGLSGVGYQAGDKIAIKINLTVCNVESFPTGVTSTGDQTSNLAWTSVTVEAVWALLDQLVNAAGVPQADIFIGDPTCHFPTREYDYLRADFPNVNYMSGRDGRTLPGRPKTQSSTVPFYWSTTAANGTLQDYLPKYYADAKYFINFSTFKAHSAAVTLSGKNHYGSLNRRPATTGYFDLHPSLPYMNPNMGSYRALVDLLGHEHTGGKTLLYMVDGFWGGYSWGGVCPPQKFRMPPFDYDYPSSLFVSQDPVAIDSVGFDFWYAEDVVSWYNFPFNRASGGHMPHYSGGTDYLREAAMADNPPSGTFYDPERDGVRMESLGVYEHWNNMTDKQYSGNLGIPGGIELVTGPTSPPATVVGRYLFYNNSSFDGNDPAANAADDAAIAVDKVALVAPATATAANYSSYDLGINGIMVDIAGASGTPTAADFEIRCTIDGVNWFDWAMPTVTVRAGAGVDGSDRVTLVWGEDALTHLWLEVKVKATETTGLMYPDVFCFGNTPGDTLDSLTDAVVTAADVDNCADNPRNFNLDDFVALKTHFGFLGVEWGEGDYNRDGAVDLDDFVILKSNFGAAAMIDDPRDHNRDTRVDDGDMAISEDNLNTPASALKLITLE